ncbi:hypothetical protein ACFPL7_04355 [Dongia soli]|uniref:Uncharacterized protein n=1 Tax=Dongia soli TaxID=600628 RepID=A0ABU5EHH8_9PROT|nr:hypothetical protein [Dongia soli]MDY0885782.1 hypothetical protein [Dongia soli]
MPEGTSGPLVPEAEEGPADTIYNVIKRAWDMSAVPDFIYPGTRGERPADFDDAIAYSSGLYRVAFRDPVVRRLILEVQQLLQPPSILHEPALMQRVKAKLA